MLRLGAVAPSSELLALQRTAYAVEAALIGDDRIPPLHESLAARSGIGTALVRSVLAAGRPAVVGTGRDDMPACALYTGLGFVPTGDRELLPGLWVRGFRYDP